MAKDLFQRLQQMALFTTAEKIVLDMIPTIAKAAGLPFLGFEFEEKQPVGRHIRFETELARHSVLYVWDAVCGKQVKIAGLEGTISLNADFGLREKQIVEDARVNPSAACRPLDLNQQSGGYVTERLLQRNTLWQCAVAASTVYFLAHQKIVDRYGSLMTALPCAC